MCSLVWKIWHHGWKPEIDALKHRKPMHIHQPFVPENLKNKVFQPLELSRMSWSILNLHDLD
jgi:hypothetical protein